MSNSKDFSGKVVIVTGSTSGIGEGIALYFSQLGANVVITGRRADEVKRVAQLCQSESPENLEPLEVVADITDDEHVKHLINSTINKFGKLDILVNNAGAGWLATFESAELMQVYDKTMRLDLRSVVYLSHLAVPHLEKTKGNIVNISSAAAIKPMPQFGVYCMAKSALDMFTKCLAVELGPKAIRVNALNVGPVKTNGFAAMGLPQQQIDAMTESMKKLAVLGRIGEPYDIALTVAFLASDDASFITGTCMADDGGVLLS